MHGGAKDLRPGPSANSVVYRDIETPMRDEWLDEHNEDLAKVVKDPVGVRKKAIVDGVMLFKGVSGLNDTSESMASRAKDPAGEELKKIVIAMLRNERSCEQGEQW